MTYEEARTALEQGVLFTGNRLEDGQKVTGELHYWDKYQPIAIITEAHHERISDGHRVNPFHLERASI